MKGIIRERRRPARAAAIVAAGTALLVTTSPVDAGTLHGPAGKIVFSYSAPEVADTGDKVTWRWSVKNIGGESVDKVVLTHELTPKLKVQSVNKSCTVAETLIQCRYGTLKAGQSRQGTLVALLPPDTLGTVQINGRVTWHQGSAADQTPKTKETQPPANGPTTGTQATASAPATASG